MTEREEFEVWLDEPINENGDLRGDGLRLNAWALGCAWESWKAGRRSAPDRDSIIEECAKVCDDRIMGDQSEGDFEAKRCAEAIRTLKTAPNGEKG
ncbi:hypothetical protein BLA17378_07989 [Burkholderia aenigmatica]|uniref:DUF982 domain-containing protein n=1 Tax=Burkholderia aenigmatica TaxID=2015348 RepID=A0ABY6Y5M2_9BURK|nr:hypothetical protein [Burkholderia aenigmatica]VWD40250.1 hypothetical protein BLA17378_07989 [Burkholderia aenigmatica]